MKSFREVIEVDAVLLGYENRAEVLATINHIFEGNAVEVWVVANKVLKNVPMELAEEPREYAIMWFSPNGIMLLKEGQYLVRQNKNGYGIFDRDVFESRFVETSPAEEKFDRAEVLG